jgi:hypothetical protein
MTQSNHTNSDHNTMTYLHVNYNHKPHPYIGANHQDGIKPRAAGDTPYALSLHQPHSGKQGERRDHIHTRPPELIRQCFHVQLMLLPLLLQGTLHHVHFRIVCQLCIAFFSDGRHRMGEWCQQRRNLLFRSFVDGRGAG